MKVGLLAKNLEEVAGSPCPGLKPMVSQEIRAASAHLLESKLVLKIS